MQQTVLILGGNGRFGRATAEAFWNAGWRVRVFDRKTDRLPEAGTRRTRSGPRFFPA
jgi:NAD(P)-dependent dehydrogenase (short-subunit alcohol dehydrogenase family)